MRDRATHRERAQTQSRAAREPIPITQRFGYSPAEFAAAFGRSPTWAYRQIYAGRVKPISDAGRLLIPRVEVDAFLARAANYNPNANPKTQKEPGRE